MIIGISWYKPVLLYAVHYFIMLLLLMK